MLSHISNLDSWSYLNMNYLQFTLGLTKLFFPNIRVVFASERVLETKSLNKILIGICTN